MTLRSFTPLLAILVLAASCTSGTDGIFASIEREQKIIDSGNLDKKATVTHMAEFRGQYWAAGGRALFSRATGTLSGDWAATIEFSGVRLRNVMAVGATSSRLFIVANNNSTTENRLLSYDGTTWSDVTPSSFLPAAMVPVRNNNGLGTDELVVTALDFKTVLLLSGATVGAAITLGPGAGANEITAAARNGNEYYLVNESWVTFLQGFTNPRVVTGLPSASVGARAILLFGSGVGTPFDGNAFLATRNGDLLQGTLASGVWTQKATLKSRATSNGDVLDFQTLLYQKTTGSEAIWVGIGPANSREGYGYATISPSGTVSFLPPADTDSNNFVSSKLNTYAVLSLFGGSDGYFLGTWAHGLWSWDATKKLWSPQ